MKRFQVFRRAGRKYYYYYEYRSGVRLPARSTGCVSRPAAVAWCRQHLPDGEAATLREWAAEQAWWVWGECRYCALLLDRSEPDRPAITHRTADDNHRILHDTILPALGDVPLDRISAGMIEDRLMRPLREVHSNKTVNNKLSVLRTMLKEAVRLDVIGANPFDKMVPLRSGRKPKGGISREEARALLDPATWERVWGEYVYYAFNLTAAATGRRKGELRALLDTDVSEKGLFITKGYDSKYGVGPTKNKERYFVPIPPLVYEAVSKLTSMWGGYVFSFTRGEKPIASNRVTERLYQALERIGVSEAERRERNITFHSWRYFANTNLAMAVRSEVVRSVIGHKAPHMTTSYTALTDEDYTSVIEAQKQLFSPDRTSGSSPEGAS